MNIIRENIDESCSVLKLNVEKSDYEQRVNDALKGYQRKASVPGFRPGKVPFGLLKRMYGGNVMMEELNKIVSENLSKYVSDNNLTLLGEPLPHEFKEPVDVTLPENFVFSFDIAVAPEFDVDLTGNDHLPFYKVIVGDEMINDEIKSLAGRYGSHIKSEKTGDASVVKGTFTQVDEAGNDIENGTVNENATLSMSVVKNSEIKTELLGKATGESTVFDLRKAFPNNIEISYLLNIPREEAETVTGLFKFTIAEITDFREAEINQELFDKLFGEGNITSLDAMKAKVKENLEKSWMVECENRFAMDARKAIIEKVNMQLPEGFLKRWILYANKDNKEVSIDDIEKEFPDHVTNLKWQLIKNKIVKNNDLKIDANDVLAYAKKAAKMQFMQYGLVNIPDEHLNSYASDLLKNQNNSKLYFDGAMEDCVIKYVSNIVQIDKKDISFEEFSRLYYEMQNQ